MQGIHPGFETDQKSKTGVSVDPQKGLMPSKNSKLKNKEVAFPSGYSSLQI